MLKTLPEEPDGMSQLCGHQITYGRLADTYCGEFKEDGLYFCQEHHNWVSLDYEDGVIHMAPGNVRGRLEWRTEARERPIPRNSGEGAIYSPEYLRKREGNAQGVDPRVWRAVAY